MNIDTQSYILGLATLPAIAFAAYAILNIVGFVVGVFTRRGYFLNLGGEDGNVFEKNYGSREFTFKKGILWVGKYRHGDQWSSRFITLASLNHGITFGKKTGISA